MNYLDKMSFNNIDLSNIYCNNNNIFNIAQGNQFNSIFGCMFGSPFGSYTPFNGNCKSALGFQLGNMLASIGLMAANCFINRKLEEKQANSPETKLGNLDAEINAELAELGENVTEANYKNHEAKDEKVFADRIKDLTESKQELKEKLSELGKKVSDGTIKNLENQREALVKNAPNYISEYDKLTDEINAAKEKNRQIDEIDKQLKENEKAEKKLEQEIAERNKEIKAIVKKLDELISKKTAIKNSVIMDEADGNPFNRKDITKLVDIKDDGSIPFKKNKDGSKVEASHIHDLLKRYNNSTTKNDKEKYGKAFIKLFKETDGVQLKEGDQKTFERALGVIKKDLNIA